MLERSSYFKVSKPKDTHCDSKNHIKAGKSEKEIDALSDEYEEMPQLLEIPYPHLHHL